MTLAASIVRRDAIGPHEVDRMYALFSRYFFGVDKRAFLRDLSNKDEVIFLTDQSSKIQGFSTVASLRHNRRGGPVQAIFSGDTIIDRSHWGELSLVQAFVKLAATKKAECPDLPLYWFLIVKGHRTFRFLPLFFKSFYPHWVMPTPRRLQGLMDGLAHERFGANYDRRSGTVRFPAGACRLKDAFAEIPEKDAGRPEVRFFLERNPGYRRGDELVCLAEIDERNLLPFALRGFLRERGR